MIAVRPASPDDLDEVLALWGSAGPEERAAVERLLAGDAGALLLAAEGGRLLGTVVVLCVGEVGRLDRLVVDASSRRQGVARSLLQAAERRLRALGATRAEAAVDPADTAAQALWQGARYTEEPGRWAKDLA